MEAKDIKVGQTYRAKKPAPAGSFFNPVFNDRTVVYISPFGDTVQYDGPAVAVGRRLPMTSMEKFLKWASHDVTASLPPEDYEPWPIKGMN